MFKTFLVATASFVLSEALHVIESPLELASYEPLIDGNLTEPNGEASLAQTEGDELKFTFQVGEDWLLVPSHDI